MSTPPNDDDGIEDRIAALLAGQLDAPARQRLEAEIDRNPRWLAVVAALAHSEGDRPPPVEREADTADRLARAHFTHVGPGTRIGRYEVTHELGRGGMGIVVAARDEALGRVVALKLLREGVDPQRATREARALARVRHPSVIEIFDVGHWRGRVYMAMERLEGVTLGAWCRARDRSIPEIVQVFGQAGDGLVAAHDVGLVHRDFKPGNVIVTHTGRVVVLDFGLAADAIDREHRAEVSEGANGPVSTQAAGTPAYMAPEQRAGRACDARADQYAFAVTLFEALHGHRPGDGSVHRRAVPRGVARALSRALAVDPAARHASMRALLEALRRAVAPRSRAVSGALAVAAVLAAAGWVFQHSTDRCEDERQALVQAWGPAEGERLRSRFHAAPAPAVAATVSRLDDFVDAWQALHVQSCGAAPARATEALSCLGRASRSLESVLELLDTGPDDARTLAAVRALPHPAACADTSATVRLTEPNQLVARDAIERELAAAEARRTIGDHPGALAHAEAALAEAEAAGDVRAIARAHLSRGLARRDAGPFEASEADLRAAIDLAARGEDDRLVGDAYTELAWVVGYALARHDEGRALLRHARAWSERVGRPPMLELQWRRAAGWIEQDAGELAAARAHFEAATALAQAMAQGDPFADEEVAMSLNGLGAVAVQAADFDAAEAAFRDATARLSRTRGQGHPSVAEVRNNLASVLRGRGRLADARALFDANLVAFTAAFGDEHSTVGQTLLNRATVALDAGENTHALADIDRAIPVLSSALGPDHPHVAKAYTLRGDVRLQLGDPEGALTDLVRSRELLRVQVGPEHPSVAIVEASIGSALHDLGRDEEALEHHLEALRVLEVAWGDDHPDLALVLVNLALVQRALHHDAAARPLLERAVTLADPSALATARTRLAELLLDEGEPARALELLEQAVDDDEGSERDPLLRAVTWLALARALRTVDRDPARATRLAEAAHTTFVAAGDTSGAKQARRLIDGAPD